MIEHILTGSKFPDDYQLIDEAYTKSIGMVRLLHEKFRVAPPPHNPWWRDCDLEVIQYLYASDVDLTLEVERYRPSHWRVHRWGIEHGFSFHLNEDDVANMLATAIRSSSSPVEEIFAFEYVIQYFGLHRVRKCILQLSSHRVVPHRQTLEMLLPLGILPDSSGALLFGDHEVISYCFEKLAMPLPHISKLKKICKSLEEVHWRLMPPENLFFWNQRKREERLAQERRNPQKV